MKSIGFHVLTVDTKNNMRNFQFSAYNDAKEFSKKEVESNPENLLILSRILPDSSLEEIISHNPAIN